MVETEDALVIGDWKSSRSRWSASQAEDATEQLLCYAALAADFAPSKPIRVEFTVLTKTKDVQVEQHRAMADPRSIDRARRVAERVWRAIEAEHFYPAPSPMNCGSCPFRKPCREWPG